MEKFRWCFIGTGKLGHQVAGQLLASGRHEIVSCYTRNMDNAKAFAEEFHCKAYGSAEEAILADGVEGVYVVTPHNAHFRYVKEALELGKPVLCEKAFTVTAEETDSLIALAREKKVYLAEAMWTWFSPAANQVKLWLMEDKLGKVTDAKLHLSYEVCQICTTCVGSKACRRCPFGHHDLSDHLCLSFVGLSGKNREQRYDREWYRLWRGCDADL